MRLNKLFITAAIFLMASMAFVGCRKKADTIVKVYVRDSGNVAVPSASVTLLATPSPDQPPKEPSDLFPMTTTTNSNGEAIFSMNEVYQLGQAGVAVLDIEVVYGSDTGSGVVKVEQEETTEEVVFI